MANLRPVEPTRIEFMHIPPWQKALFYVLAFASIGICSWQIWARVQLWRSGKPIGWKPDLLGNVWIYVIGQRKVQSSRQKSGAPMHLFIFYGFFALFIATTLLGINTYSPVKFHKGTYYLIYETTFDIFGVFFVVGVLWAFIRRWKFKPPSLSSNNNDLWTLGLLFALAFTGYLLEAARISNWPQTWDSASPVGNWMAQMLPPVSDGAYVGIWWFHFAWVFVFISVIPRMRLRHIVMAIFSTAGKPDQPIGELKPIKMEEVEETGQIGVALAKDYSRWHLLSVDACMECGRCTEVCPAHGVGKILNPKEIVLGVRQAMVNGAPIVESLTEEALWACTTCNACVEACPVTIRQVDLIVDARRNLVAEGKLSGTAATMLRQTASSGNAWGTAANTREDWMKGLDVPLARDVQSFEYLFWVGCAGSTDPGAVKTTRAFAELMNKAGVDYACLGIEESCTGDPARRVGDEFLFQERAQGNITFFEKYGVKKIVTACPHCMNTLKNEYPQFEGTYEVIHHTQMLKQLILEGRLNSADPAGTVYHDPCYLARVNNESDAPRALLGQQTDYNNEAVPAVAWLEKNPDPESLLEPHHRGRKTLCCGAGGGRMWMEEPAEQRPGNRRAEELLATGAKTIALGCPFCRIMLDASVKQITQEEIRLVDLAEMMRDAN